MTDPQKLWCNGCLSAVLNHQNWESFIQQQQVPSQVSIWDTQQPTASSATLTPTLGGRNWDTPKSSHLPQLPDNWCDLEPDSNLKPAWWTARQDILPKADADSLPWLLLQHETEGENWRTQKRSETNNHDEVWQEKSNKISQQPRRG